MNFIRKFRERVKLRIITKKWEREFNKCLENYKRQFPETDGYPQIDRDKLIKWMLKKEVFNPDDAFYIISEGKYEKN